MSRSKLFLVKRGRMALLLLVLVLIASGGWTWPASGASGLEGISAKTPEVTAVGPQRVTPGSEITLKIRGKNFTSGTRISFSNPGIKVSEVDSGKATKIVARIQVASDAEAGKTSLFVFNPDDREVEVPFEVAEGQPVTEASPVTRDGAPAETSQKPASSQHGKAILSAPLRFEVVNLGQALSILRTPSKGKGMLSLSAGKLEYEQEGAEVFSAGPGNIKEIGANTILGVDTGTFHVILDSGKTFNFVAASLKPADSQSILEALRREPH